MSFSFVSDWTLIGDQFVRSYKFHDADNLFQLGPDSMVACCPYGGPTAIATPVNSSGDAWRIVVCAANGERYGSIVASTVLAIHWSQCQKLIVVGSTGRVLVYSPFGELIRAFSMGEETNEVEADATRIFTSGSSETGLAVMNKVRQLYAVNSINSPVPWRMTHPKEPVSCWVPLSNTKPTAVLLCYDTRFFAGAMEERAQPCQFDWAMTSGRYVAVEQNPVNQLLVLVHDSPLTIQAVRGGDLHSLLFSITPDSPSPTLLIHRPMWCTGDREHIIAMQSGPSSVDFYSSSNNSCSIHLPRAVHLVADVDGIRAISTSSTHFLSQVSLASQQVLGLTSSEPGALLFEASLKLNRRDHTFYGYITEVNKQPDGMAFAMEQCLDAAADQMEPCAQKSLMRAAQMGRALCDEGQRGADANRFYLTARELRVANNLRLLGMAITNRELRLLTIPALVDRLISLRQWQLALKICELIEIPAESGVHKVLTQWCVGIMQAFKRQRDQPGGLDGGVEPQLTEERVAAKILKRLETQPGVSYADVADVAARQELKHLASLLLDREPNLARQVMVLLKLKEVDRALAKAAQSQQPDLMHLVLRHMRKTMEGSGGSGELELRLRRIPQALSLYQSCVREEAPDKALALYEQGDDFGRQAIYHLGKVRENLLNDNNFFDAAKASSSLSKAELALQSMRDPSGAQLIAGSSQLMQDNVKREERHLSNLVEKPLRETFIWAVSSGDDATAEVLRKQHKMDERQVWRWTVEGLAQGGCWQQLEQFGRAKRSPMGHLPLIEACCRGGNRELARSFLDKVTNYEDGIRAHLILGDVTRAAKLAASKQDVQMLVQMRRKFLPSSDEYQEITLVMRSVNNSL